MTTRRLVLSRGAVSAYGLRQQDASFGLYSDADGPGGMRGLPVTGALERLIKAAPSRSRVGSVGFIAQKQLELLHTLASLSVAQRVDGRERQRRTRWWVICDDDSFVFVDRLVSILGLLDDREAILAGGARARAHLCHAGFCDFKNFSALHGFSPVVHAFAGGPSYVLSDRGLRLVGRAIEEGRCLDAGLTDIATAACAQVARLRTLLLPGGWLVNDQSIITSPIASMKQRAKAEGRPPPKVDAGKLRHKLMFSRTPFKGQLLAMHKLKDRQALCWARHSECHPRCACYCACPELRAGTPARPAVRNRERECTEPTGSTCNFDCPSAAELEEILAGNLSDARTPQERKRHEADGIICREPAPSVSGVFGRK